MRSMEAKTRQPTRTEINWTAFAYQIELQRKHDGWPALRKIADHIGVSLAAMHRSSLGLSVGTRSMLIISRDYLDTDPRLFLTRPK